MKRNFRNNYNRVNVIPEDSGPRLTGINLDRAIDLFTGEYTEQGWVERSLQFHKENLNVLFNYLGEIKLIDDIGLVTTEVLKDFIGYMRNKGLKENTINGRVKTFHVFFGIMTVLGYIPHDPSSVIRETKSRMKPVIIPFSEDQIKALLTQPNQKSFVGLRDWVMMQILLDTGIRVEELINVRFGNVDFKHNSIMVVRGKGQKTRTVIFGHVTRKALMRYVAKVGFSEPEEYLFLNQDGGQLKKRTVQDIISKYGEKAGIKGVRCSPHTFRHTFAKMFVLNEGDPYVLRDLLGHADMTTVTIYLKLFRPDLERKYRGKSPVDKLFRRNLPSRQQHVL